MLLLGILKPVGKYAPAKAGKQIGAHLTLAKGSGIIQHEPSFVLMASGVGQRESST